MLKTLDKPKIQNKINCELCIYKYKNLTIKYTVILGTFFSKCDFYFSLHYHKKIRKFYIS